MRTLARGAFPARDFCLRGWGDDLEVALSGRPCEKEDNDQTEEDSQRSGYAQKEDGTLPGGCSALGDVLVFSFRVGVDPWQGRVSFEEI